MVIFPDILRKMSLLYCEHLINRLFIKITFVSFIKLYMSRMVMTDTMSFNINVIYLIYMFRREAPDTRPKAEASFARVKIDAVSCRPKADRAASV